MSQRIIQTGDARMRGFRVQTKEGLAVRFIEPADQVERLADIREIHVCPRLVRLRLDRKFDLRAVFLAGVICRPG